MAQILKADTFLNMPLSLVIGATGIIGNHVVRSLLSKGHSVRVFSRGLTNSKNLENLNVEIFKGDVADTSKLIKAMRGCEWVFHTAPYYPTNMFGLNNHLKKAHANTASVIFAVKSTKVKKFVYTSSLTTIGFHPHSKQLANENSKYNMSGNSPHPYFEVKHQMENLVLKEVINNRLPAVVVNPTGCFGPYEHKDKNLCLIPNLINRKLPAYVDRPINIVDAADVGLGHVLAAEKGVIGQRYILGGMNTSTKWVISKICEIAKVKPPFIKVPLVLGLMASTLSEYQAYLSKQTCAKIPILGLRFAQFGQHLDISKAQKDLDFKPSPIEPCFEKAIQWFRDINYC